MIKMMKTRQVGNNRIEILTGNENSLKSLLI